ncbi:MAG: TatD family hydrolase [Gammaproteobacteria bacterium]
MPKQAAFLVDSHCHLDLLDLAPFDGVLDGVLQEAREHGVGHMLCVSVSLGAFPGMLRLVEPYPEVYVSVGVHPNHAGGEEPTVERLVELAQHPRVIAIGETGLDYYRSQGDLEWQRERFRRHIAAAKAAGKPIIVHSREARADSLQILREEGASEVGGVLHCFTEDWDTARQALDLGFYISFSGIVTFRNAEELREVAKRVPLDRLLVETDSPYLTPVPHRSKPNRPAYVCHVAKCIAELRGLAEEEVARATSENFSHLFRVDLS